MKKRILFVDDDLKFIEFYRMLFETDDAAWELDFATDATDALAILDAAPCDVLVAKWRLPGVSGCELLTESARRHPATARIVVSEAADQEEVAKALAERCHFIARPIDLDALRSTIWRVSTIQNPALDEAIAKLLSDDYAVPSLPSVYFSILRAMDSPDASLSDIGEIIAQDPGILTKVLRLVNSAFFGMARRISSPTEAVQILGLQKIRSLVLSVHVFSCFDQARMKNFPLSRLWNHSMATSVIAQKICRAQKVDKITTEEAQLACMLHDVGKVILASGDPDRYQCAAAEALRRNIPLLDTEREVFGVSHAEIGAYLLSKWGLPISVVEAIALHHEPNRSAIDCFTPLTAAHVASCLETELSDPVLATTPTSIDTEYLARIGLEGRLPEWREIVEEVEAVAC